MNSNIDGKIRLTEEMKNRIVKEIKATGMSQKEFARRIPIHDKYFSAILNGHKEVSFDIIDRVGSTLGIRSEYLLGRDEYRTESELVTATGIHYSEEYQTMIDFLKSIGIGVEIEKPFVFAGFEEKINEDQYNVDGIPVAMDRIVTHSKHTNYLEALTQGTLKSDLPDEVKSRFINSLERNHLDTHTSIFKFHDQTGRCIYTIMPEKTVDVLTEFKKQAYSIMISLLKMGALDAEEDDEPLY